MRNASVIMTALALLTITGCAALSDIRNLPLDRGSSLTVEANSEVVKQAARAALKKSTCEIEEESQVNDKTTLMIGLTGMNIATLAPTMGIWCRYVIQKIDENKTAVHLLTKIRDPNDAFAKNSIHSVDSNIRAYFAAYIDEFSDQPPAPAPIRP